MKKWKIKGGKEFQHLLGRLKSDKKVTSYWDGNDSETYYFNIDNEVLYSDNHEEKQSLTSEHEEVTVEELEQLYYSKSTSTNFIVGKWYRTTNHEFYGKFLNIVDDRFTASERSLNDDYIGTKYTFSSGYTWIPATQEQIDAILPDKHPDKSSQLSVLKWSVGTYVVFCEEIWKYRIGDIDVITGKPNHDGGNMSLERDSAVASSREEKGTFKWFATKQEAEDFAKTLTTVTDMEDFKIGDWIISLINKTNFRKTGDVFQIVKFGTSQHMIYYTPNTWGDASTFRKALPHEIPTVEVSKQTKTMETIEDIQAECKRRFPIGCKFKSPSTGEIYTLNQTSSTYELVGQHAINGGVNQSYLYYNGEYAELVEEPKSIEPEKSKYLIAAEKALKHFKDAGFYVGCKYESTTGSVYTSVRELTIYSTNSKDCNIDCGGGFLWEYESNGDFDVYGKLLIEDKPQSMEREYQVGDRVECVKEYSHISIGMQGVVVEVTTANIGVSWDTLTKGHSCGDRCNVGTGYYIMTDNVRLIGTSSSNTSNSQQLNTYGLKVGDVLNADIINAWSKISDNKIQENDSAWFSSDVSFIGHRSIIDFKLFHGHVGFKVSSTNKIYLKAKGFKEFADSYYPKESKFEMFDIVECVEARGPITIGMQGVIREMNYKGRPVVGVEWFNFDNGHDLDEILQTSSGYRLDYNQVKLISRMSSLSVDYPTNYRTPQEIWTPYYVGVDPIYEVLMDKPKESNQTKTQKLLTLPTNKIYVRKSKSIK